MAGYIGNAWGRDLNSPGSAGLARKPSQKPKRFAVNYHLLRLEKGAPRIRVQVWLDDGEPVAESNAILCYLAEGTPFLPDDHYERAQVLQWLFFEQYDLEPNIAVARFWLAVSGTPERWAAELPAKQEAGYRTLAAMERHLAEHQFLVGERYTVADIALYGYTNVAEEGGLELGRFPAVETWLARVASRPRHIPIDG